MNRSDKRLVITIQMGVGASIPKPAVLCSRLNFDRYLMEMLARAHADPVSTSARSAGGVMPPGSRALVRIAFWGLAVFVAVFPALHAAHIRPTWRLEAMAAEINEKGFFRDFFFVVIVVSIVSFTNLLDNIVKRIREVSDPIKVAAVMLCVYYLFVLMYGTSRFGEIAQSHTKIDDANFDYDFTFIMSVLFVSLVTEVAISLADDGTDSRSRR